MKPPLLTTPRAVVTHFGCVEARQLRRYFKENAEHFAPWEPLRPAGFDDLPRIEERQTASLADFDAGRAVHLVALDPEGRRVLAVCNFTHIARGPFLACHLGYSVARAAEGQGLMYEVAAAAIAYMRDVVGLHRVMANHMPSNVRSARLLARLGFEREGYARAYIQIAGVWEDHVLNSLVFDDTGALPEAARSAKGEP
ncbi:MAG: 30S ribosomal protein S5 alanine N-acetyltransferase [Deltaproteobacteria bacterium HGW-Deltaproteobacteria-14]|jgi:ribosomal-protein-alanine N-acetyltransferase|nr:MAG: 30S ribosomal protein S5 alanine N-acetyltransferase [Deltaproteobacteria bacterium HGW-Deltaproteobacteria-14]